MKEAGFGGSRLIDDVLQQSMAALKNHPVGGVHLGGVDQAPELQGGLEAPPKFDMLRRSTREQNLAAGHVQSTPRGGNASVNEVLKPQHVAFRVAFIWGVGLWI